MNKIQNIMRREAARVSGQQALVRMGTVSAYDPNHYAAKVLIQPEGYETGFLPIASPWVGDNWGMFCPPTPGDVVDVHFQEGGKLAAFISLRFYGNIAQPQPVPSGEFWLMHKSGSLLIFGNNGTVTLRSAASMSIICEDQLTILSLGGSIIVGDLEIEGNLSVSGDISDQDGAKGSIQNIRDVYDSHTHPAPGGTTGAPNQQL